MTGRKRRHRHEQTLRTVRGKLERLVVDVLESRALLAIEIGESISVDGLVEYAAERLTGNVDHELDGEYARVWEWRIGELIIECDDLPALVHDFLERLPVYLMGMPTEIATAIWTELLHAEVRVVVDRIIHQVDACGQRRYLELPDGRFERNPDFLPPD